MICDVTNDRPICGITCDDNVTRLVSDTIAPWRRDYKQLDTAVGKPTEYESGVA